MRGKYIVVVAVKAKQIRKKLKQGKIILCFTKVLMNESNVSASLYFINVFNLLAVEAPE